MSDFTILYDEPHEADWFRSLNPAFATAKQESITSASKRAALQKVLAYDRPDIILLDKDTPVLVVEETVEVPSGHNVGQRFARIAAAAECEVPCLYFGPYVAKKHGGATAGPRYMNVRLFQAVDVMMRTHPTAITTICWPVDARCEVLRGDGKDIDVKQYIKVFLEEYKKHGLKGVNHALRLTAFHKRMIIERDAFVSQKIKAAKRYDVPAPSITLLPTDDFAKSYKQDRGAFPAKTKEVVLYNVGMKSIRSDPYTGMAMLYKYLYIVENSSRALILWFPNITKKMWATAAKNGRRKDVKLFRIVADAILFKDGLLKREAL